MVIVNVQRAGPSTGLPTKVEQADLFQAVFGRNGECPMPVVAPATPGECFTMAIEASRLALKYMTPVMYLSDAFIGNGAEPWRVPSVEDLPDISVPNAVKGEGTFLPYGRDPETLQPPVGDPRHARPRAPHRRPREARRPRHRQLRRGQPPPDDRVPPRQGRGHREGHPGPGGLRAGVGRPADRRLGLHLRRAAQRGGAASRPRASPSRTRTSGTSSRSRPTSATSCGASGRCWSPSSTSASSAS